MLSFNRKASGNNSCQYRNERYTETKDKYIPFGSGLVGKVHCLLIIMLISLKNRYMRHMKHWNTVWEYLFWFQLAFEKSPAMTRTVVKTWVTPLKALTNSLELNLTGSHRHGASFLTLHLRPETTKHTYTVQVNHTVTQWTLQITGLYELWENSNSYDSYPNQLFSLVVGNYSSTQWSLLQSLFVAPSLVTLLCPKTSSIIFSKPKHFLNFSTSFCSLLSSWVFSLQAEVNLQQGSPQCPTQGPEGPRQPSPTPNPTPL